ncbi:MAG TPA: STAS domain-containing protein [Gemmatimonadales bacterium]|nr:STAS domain-containing protein [Gemmatimonadales bacterium]
MRIEAARTGGAALLRLEGRLDREGAERLSDTLEDLLQEGVRTLRIDFSQVTYASSAVTRVLARWQQELAVLRGDVQLQALSPVVSELFADAGWRDGIPQTTGAAAPVDRRSYWHARADFATSGQYELSAGAPGGALTCRAVGDPGRITQGPIGADDCERVTFPATGFGLGVGAIGSAYAAYEECSERLGELIAVGGCAAYFPSDGARMADYLLGTAGKAPGGRLASGLVCEGSYSQLVRFSTRPEAEAVPLSELASVALQATGGRVAGLVLVGETAGLCGVKLRRSPAVDGWPGRFEVPGVRDWLSFAPERTHAMTTTIIAGVVSSSAPGPWTAHLRPHGPTERLLGHLHAAVFSYHPLPQRTVGLDDLVRGLFTNQQLLDVLHLLWDDRADGPVPESALVRGVGWIAPVTQFS